MSLRLRKDEMSKPKVGIVHSTTNSNNVPLISHFETGLLPALPVAVIRIAPAG
jgi:hypothetical protein